MNTSLCSHGIQCHRWDRHYTLVTVVMTMKQRSLVVWGLCKGGTEIWVGGPGLTAELWKRWTLSILGSPQFASNQGKARTKKAKKDLFLSNVAGQNLDFIINNKSENKMKQRRPQVPGWYCASVVFNPRRMRFSRKNLIMRANIRRWSWSCPDIKQLGYHCSLSSQGVKNRC